MSSAVRNKIIPEGLRTSNTARHLSRLVLTGVLRKVVSSVPDAAPLGLGGRTTFVPGSRYGLFSLTVLKKKEQGLKGYFSKSIYIVLLG